MTRTHLNLNLKKLLQLQKMRQELQLTDCLNFIEMCSGLSGEAAVFVLNEVGQTGGEA
jgi:hypothetical protein